MMTLLLTACGGSGRDDPRQLASQIRGEYRNLAGWNATVELAADYGERVFDFTVEARCKMGGEMVLTVVEPALLKGITARLKDGEGMLEYDGAGVSVGPLDEEGLNPISALPAILTQLTRGYMAQCDWDGREEERVLRIHFRHPDKQELEGTEYTLWFHPESHVLLRGEVSVGGQRRLTAVFTDFTMEMTDDDTGNHENLG